jgi:hypothetical protein
MRKICGVVILILSFLLTLSAQSSENSSQTYPLPAASQETNITDLWWINAGVGIGGYFHEEESGGPTFGVEVSYSMPLKEHLLISGRIIYSEDWSSALFFSPFGAEEGILWDVGGLISLFNKGEVGIASIGAGLAVTGSKLSKKEGFFEMESRVTVGIPLETQLFFTFGRTAGLGVIGYANVNTEWPFFGGVMALRLGVLE